MDLWCWKGTSGLGLTAGNGGITIEMKLRVWLPGKKMPKAVSIE